VKKQRPTIPLFEWTLAVDLEATRNIQNQEGTPAYNCDCQWCSKWLVIAAKILPEDIQKQLIRIGVDINHPTDLYEFKDSESFNSLRIVFHCVGKILSGPNQWKKEELGDMLMYKTVRDQPFSSLVVYPQKQSIDPTPVLDGENGELIRLDFRLDVPK